MPSYQPETRTRILQATLDLLESGQGNKVRMVDIAKKANLTRQAVYLHFRNRAELLIATTHYLSDIKGGEKRLEASRAATTGIERLNAFVDAWGNYIPEIYGLGKALLAMGDADKEASKAWTDRMLDLREGCEAAIRALKNDDMLSPDYSIKQATDILWTMLSIRNWEQFTTECGWPQKKYIKSMKQLAHTTFVKNIA